jgi:hypothetical protein
LISFRIWKSGVRRRGSQNGGGVGIEQAADFFNVHEPRLVQAQGQKGLVERLPKSCRYRLLPEGYSICLVFLKLFEKIYAPLTASLLQPFRADSKLQQHRRPQLDRLYQRVVDDLNKLMVAVGLKAT